MLSASLEAVLPPARSVGGWGGLLSAGEDSLARAQPDLEPVRRQIREAIARGGATGVAIAVAHRGRIVVEEGFGWANREAGVRVTPHTPFSMASITKPFTATTLMTLVAEGEARPRRAGEYVFAGEQARGFGWSERADGEAAGSACQRPADHV